MPIFGKKGSDEWHRQVDSAAAGIPPLTGDMQPNNAFPWLGLRMITGTYLRKKNATTELERDTRLKALLQKHTEKEVALAACAYDMSTGVLREIIQTDLSVEPGTTLGYSTYLNAIVIASHVKADSVSALEVRWARLLATCSRPVPPAPGQYLQNAIDCLRMGTQSDMLLYPHITASVQVACQSFSQDLEALRVQSQLARAQQAAGWLSTCTGSSFDPLTSDVDRAFPGWKVWAAWRPDPNRLHLWESIATEQREALRDILSLEGPDFEAHVHPRLLEGLCNKSIRYPRMILRRGKLHIKLKNGSAEDALSTLERLLKEVDAACAAGVNNLKLLTFVCVDKPASDRMPISEEDFTLLETLIGWTDRSISGLVLQLLVASEGQQGAPVDKIIPLLPAMDGAQTLRQILEPYIIDGMSSYLQNMQSELRAHLQANGQWDVTADKLREFGKILRLYPWLPPLLPGSSHLMFDSWPSHKEIKYLQTLRKAVKILKHAAAAHLTKKIDAYCMGRLVTPDAADDSTIRLVETLLSFWQQVTDTNRRAVALMVVQDQDLDIKPVLYYRCVEQIPHLPDEFIRKLMPILRSSTEYVKTASVNLARLLNPTVTPPQVTLCWRVILRRMIEQNKSMFHNYISMEVTIETWFQWLEDVGLIFDDLMDSIPLFRPGFLRPALHQWSQRIAPYLPIIETLAESANSQAAVQCILSASEEPLSSKMFEILEILRKSQGKHYLSFMQSILCLLHADGDNLWEIEKTVLCLVATSPPGVEAGFRLMELYHMGSPKLVAEVLLDSYVQDSSMTRGDRDALRALAEALNFELENDRVSSPNALNEAAQYIEDGLASLLAEAQRLENLRLSCKAIDPHGTSALLESLGVEDSSRLEDAIADLPTALVDVIDKVGEQEIEMVFPLTEFTAVQRIAMGIGAAQTILVHLIVADDGLPPGFCLHMDGEIASPSNGISRENGSILDWSDVSDDEDYVDLPGQFTSPRTRRARAKRRANRRSPNRSSQLMSMMDVHYPWVAFSDGTDSEDFVDIQTCHGKSNLAKMRLARALAKYLSQNGFESLESIYNFASTALSNSKTGCVVCGIPSTTRRIRPTTCQSPLCTNTFSKADIEIRLADIRQDPAVVDFLLTALHGVSSSNQLHLLLPGCPISTAAEITQIIDSLPAISQLQTAGDLRTVLRGCHASAETLLSWVCCSYRGFLVSATGQLRIPSMPNVHQFVMANAAPELEAAFAAKVGGQTTRVLFHGTQIGRLHPILGQGLKNCSGTALMAHGASSGNGIYMAEEPGTSWGYAATSVSVGWRNSQLRGTGAVFGCEVLAGGGNRGVHVIPDASTVMIRYIFMVAASAAAPAAAHVVPAMQSVFASIRTGAI